MRLTIVHILIIIFIFIIITVASYSYVKIDKFNINLSNSNKTNNSTNYILTITPLPTIDYNSTLSIPSNDYVINHINWSNYPYLQQGYIRDARISDPTGKDPNNDITHKYIDVEIYIEIKNDNQSEIVNEMKRVAIEARNIYGPNSLILIVTTKNGVYYNNINTYPYEDTIYGGSLF
jgi:ribosomal protein S8